MNETDNKLDFALFNSRADTRGIVLASGSATISANPKRLGMVIYSPATNPIRVIPAVSSDPGFGGVLLSPGDLPFVFRIRDFGDAAKESFIITGTGSDSVLITELTGCPCN